MDASHGPAAGGDELVTIGRVVKAHGIRGEVVVHPLSDVEGRFDVGTEVELDGVWRTIAASRPHQGRMLLGFDHLTDRSAAEASQAGSADTEGGA